MQKTAKARVEVVFKGMQSNLKWQKVCVKDCYCLVSLKLWCQTKNEKRAPNKIPCDNNENCHSWCQIRI